MPTDECRDEMGKEAGSGSAGGAACRAAAAIPEERLAPHTELGQPDLD